MRAQKLGVLDKLARVYWYTVEFGLVQQKDGLRIYGAGIASSRTESVFALDDPSPNRIAFDLERVMRTHYRIDEFQESYFVLPSIDTLFDMARTDFGPIYEALAHEPDLTPSRIIGDDQVFHYGTGAYHAKLVKG